MKTRANIVHIFTDQQRFDTIAALGNTIIKTPNMDRLVSEGVSFTNAFSPSPVCISARCSMIYGQYPANTACYANRPMPNDERESFMKGLTQVGYRTHSVGKCHFTPESGGMRGFQTRERLQTDYKDFLKENNVNELLSPFGIRGTMYYSPQTSELPSDFHPTEWVGERSAEFIKEQKNSDKPWYLFSSCGYPHPPFNPPAPWYGLYSPLDMPLDPPLLYAEELQTYANKVQNRYKCFDQGVNSYLKRTIIAYYYACISFVDYQIGKIFNVLESSGQLDNTLILLTSDHGELLGDYNCWGKRSMHDGSVRVPLVIRYPKKIKANTICEEPVSLIDIAPTFLNIAKTSISSHKLDGLDLINISNGNFDREFIFSQHAYEPECNPEYLIGSGEKLNEDIWNNPKMRRAAFSQYMLVNKNWKYIYSAPDDLEILFDKKNDPKETKNVAKNSKNSKAIKYMRNALINELKEKGQGATLENNSLRHFPKLKVGSDPSKIWLVPCKKVNVNIRGYF